MLTVRFAAVAAVILLSVVTACGSPDSEPEHAPASSTAGAQRGGSEPERFTPLVIRPLSPDPIPVTGTDGKVHVAYELEVLNASPRSATVTAVETLGPGGSVLSTLRGDQVVAISLLVADYALPPVPAKTIPAGRTLLLIMDAVFADRSAVPTSMTHRLSATYGAFEPRQGDFATNNFPASSVESGGSVTVGTGEPTRIGPPLRGDSWVAVNACCGLSAHRGAMLPVGGRINGAERYAADWSRFDLAARPIVDFTTGTQATFRGDRTKNESYFTFGQPVDAVSDGTVVTVVEDLPEVRPQTFPPLPLADLGGNRVVIRHADGVYSFYAHLKTGSVSVAVGDAVRRGQQIGQAGNTGNTSESHLHFHLMDGPDPLTATNLPWVIETLTFQGTVDPDGVDTAGAGPRKDQLPLLGSAVSFSG